MAAWAVGDWLSSTLTYFGFSLVLALLTHRAGHQLAFPGARMVSLWIPVGFLLQALLVAALLLRVPGPRRRIAHALDLVTWAPPLIFGLTARVGESPDIALWLSISMFAKVASTLFALWTSVRGGLRDGPAALALTVIAVAFFVITIPYTRLLGPATHAMGLTGDEPHYMVVTISLVRDHDLFVEDEYTERVYWPFYPADLPYLHVISARDGHHASFHDAGLPVLSTVPYALGGWRLVLVALGLATALLLREVYLIIRLVGVRPEAAILTAALVGFSLPVAAFATQVFPEVPVSLAAAVVLRQIWACQVSRRGAAIVAGLALAALPWIHVRAWPLAIGLMLTALVVWQRWRDRAAVVVPLLVSTGGYAALNTYVYGQLLPSPYFGYSPIQRLPIPPLANIVAGQARPWLDGYDGLLLLTPVFVLALIAAPSIVRMGRAGAGTILAAVPYCASVGVWEAVSDAAWSPPARFMVPVIPLLAVPLAVAIDRLRGKLGRLIVPPLAMWGLACSFFAFADRVAVYTITRMDGAVRTLADTFGIPVWAVVPNFLHPDLSSLLKIVAVSGVLAAAAVALSLLSTEPKPAATLPVMPTSPSGDVREHLEAAAAAGSTPAE